METFHSHVKQKGRLKQLSDSYKLSTVCTSENLQFR